MTLSIDLRKRVLADHPAGLPKAHIAKKCSVGLSSVIRRVKRFMKTGSLALLPPTSRTPNIDERAGALLRQWVTEENDWTLAELRGRWRENGYSVASYTVGEWRERLKLSHQKKTMRARERDRPDVQAQRAEWTGYSASVPREIWVFWDESSASTSLARLYGRAAVGERLRDSAPAGHWLTRTMRCALRRNGPFTPALFDGPVDGDGFAAWLEQGLIPELRPGEVGVMDNLGTHRMASAAAMIRGAGFDVR